MMAVLYESQRARLDPSLYPYTPGPSIQPVRMPPVNTLLARPGLGPTTRYHGRHPGLGESQFRPLPATRRPYRRHTPMFRWPRGRTRRRARLGSGRTRPDATIGTQADRPAGFAINRAARRRSGAGRDHLR